MRIFENFKRIEESCFANDFLAVFGELHSSFECFYNVNVWTRPSSSIQFQWWYLLNFRRSPAWLLLQLSSSVPRWSVQPLVTPRSRQCGHWAGIHRPHCRHFQHCCDLEIAVVTIYHHQHHRCWVKKNLNSSAIGGILLGGIWIPNGRSTLEWWFPNYQGSFWKKRSWKANPEAGLPQMDLTNTMGGFRKTSVHESMVGWCFRLEVDPSWLHGRDWFMKGIDLWCVSHCLSNYQQPQAGSAVDLCRLVCRCGPQSSAVPEVGDFHHGHHGKITPFFCCCFFSRFSVGALWVFVGFCWVGVGIDSKKSECSPRKAVFPVLLAHLGAAAAGKWKPAKLH